MLGIPQRRADESELNYLRRKEVFFGLWQGDALERMADNERVIAELRAMLGDAASVQAAINAAVEALAAARSALLPFAELVLVMDEKPKVKRRRG